MKHVVATLALTMVLSCSAWAQDVGTSGNQGNELNRSRRLDDSESLRVNKGKTKKETSGTESRVNEQQGRARNLSSQITAEKTATSLFLPMLQQIERREVKTGDNPIANLFQACRFFTSAQPVPSTIAFEADHIGQYRNWLTNRSTVSFEPNLKTPRASVSGDVVWRDHPLYHQNIRYNMAPARTLARCYFGYGVTVAEAMNNMARQAVNVGRSPLGDEKVVYMKGNLEDLAASALVEAMRSQKVASDIEQYTMRTTSGGCMLPTIYGMISSQYDWSCGGLKVDPSATTATLGGMEVIGNNTFMGHKVSFAQVGGATQTTEVQRSKGRHTSSEESAESGQSVTLEKTKATSMEKRTTTGMSGKSGVTASPK